MNKAKIDYSGLRQIIFEYFKQTQGLELGPVSIGYLQDKLAHNSEPRPFLTINGEFGETRFDISKEDIEKIFKTFLANNDYELTSSLELGDSDTITFTYKWNPEIKNEMNKPENKVKLENYDGKISYSRLRQIIFDYFKQTQGLELSSISIGYLQDKLTGQTGQNSDQPFFVIKGEFGETRFDISKEDMEKVFKLFLATKDYELTSSLEFGNSDTITFTYKSNSEIRNKMNKPENKVELDLTYDGSIEYKDLRQIIFDHYKNTKGIVLGSISIGYIQNKLTGQTEQNIDPFFVRKDEFGETRFDIPKEEIQEILKSHLASKGYELTELNYDYKVKFKYKKVKKNEQEKTVDSNQINESGEIIRDGKATSVQPESDAPNFEPTKNEPLSEEQSKVLLEQVKTEQKIEPMHVKDDELVRMAREKRKFTILQRERAMSEAQKGKNRSAIMAGICILGAAVAVYFNGQDVNQVLQHELNAIYSWESLVQYIQDLGPLTTLLSVGALEFIAKYMKHSRKFKNAKHEFEDFNASLENNNIEELGGNENAKSR